MDLWGRPPDMDKLSIGFLDVISFESRGLSSSSKVMDVRYRAEFRVLGAGLPTCKRV